MTATINETLLEKFIAIQPTARTTRLREYYLENTKRDFPVYRIEYDVANARSMKATEGEPMVLRRAKAFAAAVDAMPADIFPDEPFVGWFGGEPRGIPVGAEQLGARLEVEVDHYKYMSDEDRKTLKEEVIPYWKGEGDWRRHFAYNNYAMLPPDTREMLYGDPDPDLKKIGMVTRSAWPGMPHVEVNETAGEPECLGFGIIIDAMNRAHIGHSSFGYRKVLQKGFLGVKKDAEDRLARIDWTVAEDQRKVPFLRAVIVAMDAAARVGQKFADAARSAAKSESDPKRKAELERMAVVCERVPAHPARTFHEALQSVWFTHILNWVETPITGAVSPGRADQYLYPYYEADLREGRITREEAQELIDCWLMRFTQGASPYLPLASTSHHLDVGGLKEDGSDATNELSFMIIEGMMHSRMVEPNLGVLVHSKTPDDLLIKASQLCILGTGYPAFLNMDAIVENFLARGTLGGPPVPISLARTSGTIGCNEPHVTDHDSEFNLGSAMSLPKMLELTLSDGWSWMHGKYMGARTGDPREFKTFAELQDAFKKQMAYVAAHCEIAIQNAELALAAGYPTVYSSALIEDCIENGRTREEGGARFNFGPVISTVGAADTGDSLAAIKKLVYDEKRFTMSEILDALETNFEGHESLREELLKAPKFGNDDDYVDEITAWVMKAYCDEVIKHENTRGGHLMPYQNALGWYVASGMMIGALPSGRKAFQPLSDSMSPTMGADLNGPTAVFNSASKIDNVSLFYGQTLNVRLSGETFANDVGLRRFANLIRAFVDLKIHHCQFNLLSSETLRDAQRAPENYGALVVRVAGYVGYFTRLYREVQDAVIARTEHAA
jgi:formate C-acetyltransferase